MSTVLMVVIVMVAIPVLCGVGSLSWKQQKRRDLRDRFGPEYDRAVEQHEDRREAERELLARQKRHAELSIRPLPPETRERHRAEWRLVQEHFVDAPGRAVVEADHLLVVVMGERGYPTENYEQQAADLSVEHATTVDRYRKAHDISSRAETEQTSTEDLRQAMVHYRALFTELVGIDGDLTTGKGTSLTEPRPEAETGIATSLATETASRTEAASRAVTESRAENGTERRTGAGHPASVEAEVGRSTAAHSVTGQPKTGSPPAETGTEEGDVRVAGRPVRGGPAEAGGRDRDRPAR